MGTVIVGAVVLAIVGLAVYSIVKKRKTSSCGGGCSGCSPSSSDSCH